jgi:hypothetical protein
MTIAMQPIYTNTIGAGGTTNTVIFYNIPQTFTDLKLSVSFRGIGAGTFTSMGLQFGTNNVINSSGGLYSLTYLQGIGGGAYSSKYTSQNALSVDGINLNSLTANTFASGDLHIPNYTSSNFKSLTIDTVGAGNSSTDYDLFASAGLWRSTNPIDSMVMYLGGTNFAQHSTVTLYGITKG